MEQFRYPLRVAHICLTPRHVLDVASVHDHAIDFDAEAWFKRVVYRMPVYACAFAHERQ